MIIYYDLWYSKEWKEKKLLNCVVYFKKYDAVLPPVNCDTFKLEQYKNNKIKATKYNVSSYFYLIILIISIN